MWLCVCRRQSRIKGGTAGDRPGGLREDPGFDLEKKEQAPEVWGQDRSGTAAGWLRDREDTEIDLRGGPVFPSRTRWR